MIHKKTHAGFKARMLASQTLYLTNRKTNLQSELRSFLSHNRQHKTPGFKSQSRHRAIRTKNFFWTSASLRLCGETSNQRLGLQHPPQQVLLRHSLPHPHILQLLLPPQELLRPFPCPQFPGPQFPYCPHPSSSHHRLTALHCKTLRHAQSLKTHCGVKAHLCWY